MTTKQPRSQFRRDRILEAALQVFSRKGYRDTAVDDIAVESDTSKGGVYFHFPNKQEIFLALLDRMAALLRSRIEAAIAEQRDPVAKAEAALRTVLRTFASHRSLARLFLVEALGAGREFDERMLEVRASFADLIRCHLDEAIRQGAIPQLDTAITSRVWFGALSELVTNWALTEQPGRLEDAYPLLRTLLLRGIGVHDRDDPWPAAAPAAVSAPALEAGLALEEGRLAAALRRGWERAQSQGRPALVSAVLRLPLCDPLLLFERAAGQGVEDRWFWSSPNREYVMAGAGAAWQVTLGGPARFTEAAAAWRQRCASAVVAPGPGVVGTGLLALAGFSFDPVRPATGLWERFPPGLLALPRYLLTATDGEAWLTVNVDLDPAGDPAAETSAVHRAVLRLLRPEEPEEAGDGSTISVEDVVDERRWKALVRTLLKEIGRGEVEKVVLARERRARSAAPFAHGRVLRRLRADYPGCFTFAVARGGHCFLGATPERLVRLRRGTVWASCLAGSTGRGATLEEDRRLGERLLANLKERDEHAVVVRALYQALAGLCEGLTPPGEPTLMKVRNVQHLFTPVAGRAAEGRGILDLVAALHPTPAVGGHPREAALELIRRHEGLDRGWYAGPLGWVDARGEGEFAVALRSALLRDGEAALMAGCGIVAGSDPDWEWQESCLKLRPALTALGGNG